MTKHVIVGYDQSDGAVRALNWAADEAVARGCGLTIVRSFRMPATVDLLAGMATAERDATAVDSVTEGLARVEADMSVTHPSLKVRASATSQPAWSALVEGAHSDDLIVVGASSHSGAKAFWLGSTPRAVVRHAPCPVVVVRGLGVPHVPVRVIVGYDGSSAATDALRWAIDTANRDGAPLLVVHAWEYPYATTPGDTPRPTIDFTAAQARDLTQVDAACMVEAAVEQSRELGAGDVNGVLVEGTPASALLSYLRDGDLFVIGTRGRGALAGVFGSTANAVLDRANVPVVVVRDGDS